MPRPVTRKRLLRSLSILAGIFVLTLIVWMAVAGPLTVLRILRFGDTNIDDFSHYPGRALQASASPMQFTRSEEELRIPADVLAAFGDAGELDSILASNDSIGFLIIQSDTILFERYYQGHSASSISQVFSMSKSFTSTLIGMAIEDGYILGEDQPITELIPELETQGFSEVTVKHLLTMMSGSSYNENDNPFGEHVILNYTPVLERQILNFTMEREPGTFFRYKSGDNALLALALDRALGTETITDYTQRRLWAPMGMEDDGMWTIDHAGDGLEKTWCCLAASARDIAKLGRLYLHRGNVQDRRLISADWIEHAALQGQIPEELWPEEFVSAGWWNYGYQWWLASREAGDYFALGKDGQFLYVHPDRDLIIVRLGWSPGELRSSEWIALFQVISNAVN